MFRGVIVNKNKIYIDDRIPVIPEEYEKMSYEELEKICEEMKKKTLEKIRQTEKNKGTKK